MYLQGKYFLVTYKANPKILEIETKTNTGLKLYKSYLRPFKFLQNFSIIWGIIIELPVHSGFLKLKILMIVASFFFK